MPCFPSLNVEYILIILTIEDFSLLWCDPPPLGKWFLMVWRCVLSSSSRVSSPATLSRRCFYFILHDVAHVWLLFNDTVSSSDFTASINKLKNLCKRPMLNLCSTNHEERSFYNKHLWAKNANRDYRIRRSALVRQLHTWRQNGFIQTFTHTFHWSNICPLKDECETCQTL